MLGKNGSENTRVSDSETTRAIVSVRRVTSVRAARLGVYRSCSIASRTASRVAGRTLGDPFTTRDTVAVETVASRATSAIVWLQLPLRHRPRRLRHTRAPGSGQREIRLAGGEGRTALESLTQRPAGRLARAAQLFLHVAEGPRVGLEPVERGLEAVERLLVAAASAVEEAEVREHLALVMGVVDLA